MKTTSNARKPSLSSYKTPHDLIIFTDLDGTLLDHDSYSFSAALPALKRLEELSIPLILVSSKTAFELIPIRQSLNNQHPFIAENGGVILIPEDYFPEPDNTEKVDGYWARYLGITYDEIIATVKRIRDAGKFQFSGFHDLSNEEVARDTGLSVQQATLARKRLCSEPLRWQDTGQNLEQFKIALKESGLDLIAGGRYLHVLAKVDKQMAIDNLLALFHRHRPGEYTTLALGDSPNDLSMLKSADIAVVIRKKDGSAMQMKTDREVIFSDVPGPEGWNEVILGILKNREMNTQRIKYV